MAGFRWLLSGLLCLAGLLAACGGDGADPSPTATATPTEITPAATPDPDDNPDGDGRWAGAAGDLELQVQFFIDPGAEPLANFEALRVAAGAPEVVYASVTATNTGTEPAAGRFITLTGEDGDVIGPGATVMDFACALASQWAQAPGLNTQAINVYQLLYNGPCFSSTAGPAIPPGETITYFVAVEATAPPEFERAFAGDEELED